MPGAVLDPIESHIDGFGYFLFDCAVDKSFQGRVVNADWSRWLWVPKFLEGIAYRHGLLAIVKSGTNFGFSGGRHHVVEDISLAEMPCSVGTLLIQGLSGPMKWLVHPESTMDWRLLDGLRAGTKVLQENELFKTKKSLGLTVP